MNKMCPNCYQSNLPQAMFCSSCATPLESGQQNRHPPPPQNRQPPQQNYGGYQQQGVKPSFGNPVGYTAEASSRAKWACALGFLGLVCLGLFGSVPAIFMGWAELDAIKQGKSPESGRGMASLGLWTGIISTVLQIGAIFIFFLLVVMEAALSPYDY